MAATKKLTTEDIDGQITAQEGYTESLEQRQQEVETLLGVGDGDGAALAIESVTLAAQIKAAFQQLTGLQQQRQDSEKREALTVYVGHYQTIHRLRGQIGTLDDQIADHQAAISDLQKQKEPLKTDRQTASGKRIMQARTLLAMGVPSADMARAVKKYSG